MSKKVYAVTRGTYSDYQICAIFSTEEKALAHIDALKDSEINGIETYDLDPPTSDMIKRGYRVWNISMDRDGNVLRRESSLKSYFVESADRGETSLWGAVGEKMNLHAKVWAKTETAAIKIVNEKRAQMIASGKWDMTRKK